MEAAQTEAATLRSSIAELDRIHGQAVSNPKSVASIRSQYVAPGSASARTALIGMNVAPVSTAAALHNVAVPTGTPVSTTTAAGTGNALPASNAPTEKPVAHRVTVPGPDKWTDNCLTGGRVAEVFCEDLEVHCAYLGIDPAEAMPNFLTGRAREVWYPATRNAYMLLHNGRPTWPYLRVHFMEMAGDDLRNESEVHRRKLLDPNALRMTHGSTLNSYITEFRNTLTYAGANCMQPSMLVTTFV
ncbi:hypothetical protein, partial [Bosea sp. (in: a-proteobacteria)]|uniref:hypothetical protein n=1 Tax=Bosea sp. (in: a-proteobacteria) TaxID=1871050 RepID=UPI004033D2C3